jgi:glycosyltransferase involved in cell wall biosynthesis
VKLNVIAGPQHERSAAAAGRKRLLAPDPRICVRGFVEDVRPAYRDCDLAVIPLPVSAGTNIKLMEAMACGRAVVSTEVGCHGLELRDEADLLIREIGPAFAEAVIRLLQDEETRNGIAARARRTAELRFGWNSIALEALESYAVLMDGMKEPVPGDRFS